MFTHPCWIAYSCAFCRSVVPIFRLWYASSTHNSMISATFPQRKTESAPSWKRKSEELLQTTAYQTRCLSFYRLEQYRSWFGLRKRMIQSCRRVSLFFEQFLQKQDIPCVAVIKTQWYEIKKTDVVCHASVFSESSIHLCSASSRFCLASSRRDEIFWISL